MKYQTTAKAIRAEYAPCNILSIGYCDAQFLLSPYSPDAYTCGVYGWNFDVYEINGIAICTGYRGMPKGMNYDSSRLRFFEEKARDVCRNAPYEKRNAILGELLRDFIGECDKLNKRS